MLTTVPMEQGYRKPSETILVHCTDVLKDYVVKQSLNRALWERVSEVVTHSL